MREQAQQAHRRRRPTMIRTSVLTLPLTLILLSLGERSYAYAFSQTRISRRLSSSARIKMLSPLAMSKLEDETDTGRIDFFMDEGSTESTDNSASFGDVVSLRKPSGSTSTASSASASFGDVVGLQKPSTAIDTSDLFSTITSTSTSGSAADEIAVAEGIRNRNTVVAALSIVFALSNWLWQWAHPLQPIQLLAEMQQQSAPVSVIGRNDKPTVIDFWAPWCENCKLAAPTLRQVEQEYGGSVNFVMVNGDLAASWPYIEAFGVDAIPHLAFVSAAGDVETALIGPVPKHVLRADIDTLLENSRIGGTEGDRAGTPKELPYKMLDVFAGKPAEARRVSFEEP